MERRHHIATDHGPMVQGGLLTAHTGSVHGNGEAPGGESSLRQGAGTGSPGSPDLETAVAAEQRGVAKKDSAPRVFGVRTKYSPKGGRGWTQGSRRSPGTATP